MKLQCQTFSYWLSIPIFSLFLLFNLCPSALAQDKVASLHPPPDLVWQRTSPSSTALEGPVLYQIIFRSSATPGSVPKISNSFTLTNSLITDNGTLVAIGGMSVNGGSGIITFAGGQTFPGAGGGGVTSLSAGAGISLSPSPITTTGSIAIANGGVTTTQIGSGAASNGQVLTANGTSGASWQTLTSTLTNAWSLNGNIGTGCSTSPCADFLGTIDNTSLELRVNNFRAYRIEPATPITFFPSPSPNIIAGFSGNNVIAGAGGATIAGGGAVSNLNRVTDDFGTVGGGSNNQAGDNAGTTADRPFATVGGGLNNTASGAASTVGGGGGNNASAQYSTVGGGSINNASGTDSTVGGGHNNTASGDFSTVGGGDSNINNGLDATVGGGHANTTSGDFSTVGGGESNTANGLDASVAGGTNNIASGTNSFAAGHHANTNNHQGGFAWGDNSTSTDVSVTVDNQFVARTSGGVTFFTNSGLTTGVQVAAGGGSWASVSDRNVKANFAAIDGKKILAKLASLPVETWNYTSQDAAIRHIGPMAQDFYAAFHVGEDDRHITQVDEGGVAFAAIQGLNQKLEEEIQHKDSQIAVLSAQQAAQTEQMRGLETEISSVRQTLQVQVAKR